MLVVVIDGVSGSFSRNTNLQNLAKQILEASHVKCKFFTLRPKEIYRVTKLVLSTDADEPILLIGKSLGSVRLWGHVWSSGFAHILATSRPIGIFLIDAHGPKRGTLQIYGKRRALTVPQSLRVGNLHVCNLYQRNRWPYGAKIEGNLSCKTFIQKSYGDPEANHFNIVDPDKRASRVTKFWLVQMLKRLQHE